MSSVEAVGSTSRILVEDSKKNNNKKSAKAVPASVTKKALEKTEKPVPNKKAAPKAKVVPLKPSDAEWTKVDATFGWAKKAAGYVFISQILVPRIQSKVKPESLTLIQELDLSKIKTVGDIEVFAISILELEMTDQKHKEEIHIKLQTALQVYAKEGLVGAKPALQNLMPKNDP